MIAKTFDELISALKLKFLIGKPKLSSNKGTDLDWCYELLIEVSRSFSLVIQELPNELRDSICIFYLVLRGLDTVEDDPNIEKDTKISLLNSFGANLDNPGGFDVLDCGHRDYYRRLMKDFHKVCLEYQKLQLGYRKVIQNATNEMAEGMIYFLEKGVETIEEYDKYCHYVAGIVGQGLTDLFVESGLESKSLSSLREVESNNMGLFLQKTNIIRDYYEDIREDRVFWPTEIWKKYANNIDDFKEEKNFSDGVKCINELVANALELVPDVFTFLGALKNNEIFNFCAIPQVMAIATLAEVYNNEDCFRQLVKIRKGMTAKLIYYPKSINDVKRVFRYFALVILNKVDKSDNSAQAIVNQCNNILRLTENVGVMPSGTNIFGFWTFSVVTILGGAISYGIYSLKNRSK